MRFHETCRQWVGSAYSITLAEYLDIQVRGVKEKHLDK